MTRPSPRVPLLLVALSVLSLAAASSANGPQAPAAQSAKTLAGALAPLGTPTQWTVTIVDLSVQSASVDSAGTMTTTVLIANSSTDPQWISVHVSLRSVIGTRVTTGEIDPATAVVPSGVMALEIAVKTVDADRDLYPLNGWLTIEPADSKLLIGGIRPRVSVPISAVAFRHAGRADSQLVCGSILAALVAVFIAAVALKVLGSILRDRMGGVTWSFTEGWSSTLMIGGPLLTSLVQFAGLPEYPASMSKTTYILVSLLLAGLIGVAPAIYNLIRIPTPVTKADGTPSTQHQGLVWMFLIASLFTVTGCLAQLGLLRMLFSDLAAARLLSGGLVDFLRVTFRLLQIALWIYAVVSIVRTVQQTRAAPGGDQLKRPQARAAENHEQELARPLPEWSPL